MDTLPAANIPAAKPLSRLWTVGIPLLVTAVMLPAVAAMTAVLLLWFIHLWDIPFWSVCVLGVLFVIGGTYLAWRFMRSLARRRFQFTIRSMLLAITLFALFFGLFWNRLHQILFQERAIRHVMANGGCRTYYAVAADEQNWLRLERNFDPFAKIEDISIWSDYAIPAILDHPDEFSDLVGINIDAGISDEGLERVQELSRFPKFRAIGCSNVSFTDVGLEQIAKCSDLKILFINGAGKISDNGLNHLQNLRKLDRLAIIGEGRPLAITDAGLKHIGQLSQLKHLWLGDMPITDAGLDDLGKVFNLRGLHLSDLSITDDGIKHLRNLTNLDNLGIVNCKSVTRQGVIELGKALPHCRITIDDKDIAELVDHLEVWEGLAQEKPLKRIADPAQIAKIIDYLNEHNWSSAAGWNDHPKEECLEGIGIDIFGRGGRFYRIFLGKAEYFFGLEKGWSSHSIPIAEEREFLNLLGLDAAKYLGNAKHTSVPAK